MEPRPLQMPGGAAMLDPFARDFHPQDPLERARTARVDLGFGGLPRVNLLFIGADDLVWRILGTQLNLRSPIASWRPGEPLVLPEVSTIQTLILRDVGHLAGVDQVRLLRWLDQAVGRTQVVSTSPTPLVSLLEDGSFINSLYYRLNTVCVDLT